MASLSYKLPSKNLSYLLLEWELLPWGGIELSLLGPLGKLFLLSLEDFELLWMDLNYWRKY